MEYGQGNVVLVIDDDEINLIVAKTVLEKTLKCKVVTAASGVLGLEIIKQQHVDVVLLDIEMPYMDGFEVLEDIRGNVRVRDIPVIMLTASADKDTIMKVAKLGVAGYIKKPFLPEELSTRVKKFLQMGRRIRHVLVVDEDERVLDFVKKSIESEWSFHVLTASSGLEALDVMKDAEIHLVLLEKELPFLDGQRILDIMQRNEEMQNVPVILMSAHIEAGDETIPGVQGVLDKPFDSSTLHRKVMEVVGRAS